MNSHLLRGTSKTKARAWVKGNAPLLEPTGITASDQSVLGVLRRTRKQECISRGKSNVDFFLMYQDLIRKTGH